MYGTLYLCATPIGNLKDMTERVRETLAQVDLIAAEDTRNSIRLLNYFEIKTPMTSYHEYNKVEKAYTLIAKLKEGADVALISDAGTPAISDPGEVLVRMCQEDGIPVTSLPGPCACITALTLSGLSSRRFCFEGFLPSDKHEKKNILNSLQNETRTIILYAAPHDLKQILSELYDALGEREIAVCRELTKKFETVVRTTLPQAAAYYEEHEPRGEYVLVIGGRSLSDIEDEKRGAFLKMPMEEHLALYEANGMDRKSAMKQVAKDRGISKREVYQYLIGR